MLVFNVAVPWLTLWIKRIRSNATAIFIIGLLINIGMWFERYVIIPISLTITRNPFTWRVYIPNIEIYLTIGTVAFFILLYMIASRLIPLVPVWEVQEGQLGHTVRQVGKATVPAVSELD
jgi:molybdopterin-containing oxidoreductase family membrane subunit